MTRANYSPLDLYSGLPCLGHLRSGVPQNSETSPLLFLLFVNDLPDALETLTMLFADDVKLVTPWTQNMNLHISLIAA